MNTFIMFLNTKVEEEIATIIAIIGLIILTIVCLTIIKKLKDR